MWFALSLERRNLFSRWSPCVSSSAPAHEGCLMAHALAGNLSGMSCSECGSTCACRCCLCSHLKRMFAMGSYGSLLCPYSFYCGYLTLRLIFFLQFRFDHCCPSHWNLQCSHEAYQTLPLKQPSDFSGSNPSLQLGSKLAGSFTGAIKWSRQET